MEARDQVGVSPQRVPGHSHGHHEDASGRPTAALLAMEVPRGGLGSGSTLEGPACDASREGAANAHPSNRTRPATTARFTGQQKTISRAGVTGSLVKRNLEERSVFRKVCLEPLRPNLRPLHHAKHLRMRSYSPRRLT